jgi:renalase
MNDFLIIGAGLAGIACAADLRAQGARVVVLDKGRGVGGRCATRRLPGNIRVDHGAQFFTARTERLQTLVERGMTDGWIAEWYRTIPLWQDGKLTARPPGHPRYMCPAGMSELPKRLSEGLDIRLTEAVTTLEHTTDGFRATTAAGVSFEGKKLVLNLPPAQLLELARPLLAPETTVRLEAVPMEPRWAAMFVLSYDIDVTWPALELEGHPALVWLARDHTKRGEGAPPTLVAHADVAWTQERLEMPPNDALSGLASEVEKLVKPVRFMQSHMHRWRYAKTPVPLGAPFLEAAPDLYACGDWCVGGRVEGAIESGWALAAHILAR